MKKALIVSIIVMLLVFAAAGCTRNNTPGNTVGPPATMVPDVTDDILPDITNPPAGTDTPDVTVPNDTVSPGLSPGVTVSPTATIPSAAG